MVPLVGLQCLIWYFLIILTCSFDLRNEVDFWNVHGIINTSGLLQSKSSPKGFTFTLQETRSIHDSMNLPKIGIFACIYILL